jgi:peptidyl-prolyl cis-trans isomerase B (cyclophilin B)
MKTKFFIALSFICCSVIAFSQASKTKVVSKQTLPSNGTTQKVNTTSTEKLVEITTDYGVMIAKLYDSTPKHRDNFLKLVNQKFYDSLLFHRVINGFMIQGGDPTSKNADSTTALGGGSAPGERIPAEFKQNFFHKKGALAAARDGNPEKASSNCQFYIVQGKKTDTAQLRQISDQRIKVDSKNYVYSSTQKEIYQRIGGTAFLDQNYTVFGEVISGLNVLDAIANTPTQPGDRPKKDIRMKIKLLN